MFEALAKALAAGLSIWEHKEKTKYLDKLIELRRRYHEATNRPPDQWDDAVIDCLEFELRLCAIGFSATVAGPNAPPKP